MFYCVICESGDCCERCDLPLGQVLCDECYEKALKEMMSSPPKCINCIHHKQSKQPSGYISYCEYIEHYNGCAGTPVPYPYFYKQEYKCPGHEAREVQGMMHVKCRNCPDIRFKLCNSQNIITDGKLKCEVEREETKAVCSQCEEKLVMGHFAVRYGDSD